jgi:type I restriction enzyme R subunit
MPTNTPHLNELNFVETSLLEQLAGLGWQTEVLKGPAEGAQFPEDSGRNSLQEVVIETRLAECLKRINPWLEGNQISEVVRRVVRPEGNSLLEMNQDILELLLKNPSVAEDRTTGRKNPPVHLVDFDNPARNDFFAVTQLKVKLPGVEKHIYPDLVCFLNGLPVVVVECKSPKISDPMGEAIDQLLRYSQQRGDAVREGSQRLFAYNQFVVATCRSKAMFGTISTRSEKHFYRWTDPYPFTVAEVATGTSAPNDQQRLVAGMLSRQNLLDLIHSFTIFRTEDKQTIKLVGRYQQFRAVKKITQRLLNGENPLKRGGIVWHTQGSGKSLTMMFLVREMKHHPELKKWKIVFVTDRTDLERQLSATSAVIGYTTKTIKKRADVDKSLMRDNADLVMVMIHKFGGVERLIASGLDAVNDSARILVMTDEAHRTQYSELAANLRQALPNATHVGFTGTPIGKTERTYVTYIDEYTMRQSVDDGVTVEIVYEGRTNNGEVTDAPKMNEKFIDVFIDYPEADRQRILGYATRQAYLEANAVIKDKARDMIDHYAAHILPNGFKAQVVAPSRIACLRYRQFLLGAIEDKITELEKANPFHIPIDRLRALKVAVIISGAAKDSPGLKEFTPTATQKDNIIADFKLPFPARTQVQREVEKSNEAGTTGIVVVTSMLLTGFDAPVEQVMYLDRRIVAHNLLQAIARVNRVGPKGKDKGFIIDYIGIGHHLKRAILEQSEGSKEAKIDAEDADEILAALTNISQELSELALARDAMMALINEIGNDTGTFDDLDAFYNHFYDEEERFKFIQLFRKFTACYNNVLPDPRALEYRDDYNRAAEINVMVGQHLRDERMSMRDVPDKLRAITDEYLESHGIDQTVPPLSIMDKDFLQDVNNKKSKKAKATAMAGAIRAHIDENAEKDPELYAELADRLLAIFAENAKNWALILEELKEFLDRMKDQEKQETYGLDPRTQMPFYRILLKELIGDDKTPNDDEVAGLVNLTQLLTVEIKTEIRLKAFWDRSGKGAQSRLRQKLIKIMLEKENLTVFKTIFDKRNAIATKLMETAQANHEVLLYD